MNTEPPFSYEPGCLLVVTENCCCVTVYPSHVKFPDSYRWLSKGDFVVFIELSVNSPKYQLKLLSPEHGLLYFSTSTLYDFDDKFAKP